MLYHIAYICVMDYVIIVCDTACRVLVPPALYLCRPGGLPGIVYRIYGTGTVHNIIELYTYNTQCAVLGVGSSPASTTFPVLAAPASIVVVVCVIISGLPPVRLELYRQYYRQKAAACLATYVSGSDSCMIHVGAFGHLEDRLNTVGFILIPSWLLGRRARPRRGGRAERSGGLAISSPGTARIRSQNFLISIIYRVRATGGLTKGGRGAGELFLKK
jgi:hypothetical protein